MMTLRERFLNVLAERDPSVRTLKWEFGYWGETINNWYRQGLPKKNPVIIQKETTTPTSGLFLPAWNCENKYVKPGEYPKGFVHCAGGLAWPTQGMGLDSDVREYFKMDKTQRVIDVNLLFYPMFDVHVTEETEDRLVFWDIDGVQKVFLKEQGTMPSGHVWPLPDRNSWYRLKEERLSPDRVMERLPENWDELIKEYRERDYPLGIGGLPFGMFGTLAHIMGYEKLFISYYEDPDLVKDITQTFTDLWIAVLSKIAESVQLDFIQFWEDISMGTGSMVSRGIIEEFMVPYYKQITDFGRAHGIKVFFIDTDGYCMNIIDLFIRGGCNAMYPFEVHAGMDVMEVRKKFPDLAILGGIDKLAIGYGRDHVEKILDHISAVIKFGGYVPFGDHLISPEIGFEDFEFYRNRLNDIIDSTGRA